MKTIIQRLLRKYFDLKYVQETFLKVETNIEVGDLICPVNNESVIYEAMGIYYTHSLEPLMFFKDLSKGQIYAGKVYEYKRAPVVSNVGFPII